MRGPAVLLLLAGCAPLAAVVDPTIAQLDRWRHAAPAEIAVEPVACPAGHAACPRLHLLRAEACMRLAMAARAPGAACPALRGHLPCAAQSYAAARALTPDPKLAAGEAQARLCLAELSPPGEDLAEAASAASAANSPLLGARVALLAARPGAGADARRCAAAQGGLPLAPAGSREAADLARRIATIPHCGATP
ncbi:hypothetical protein [Roseococcus sp. SYP-B2431]|uniref:hypothetical protein n=1 Tax=Roseococcus sp. SYP-B2431 TaxID=2496640 RepID=UPI0019802B99|nr:hypothetical protein [Roseococcus sp. SYP-B2431]